MPISLAKSSVIVCCLLNKSSKVTICAISAAFAACSTSLLCIILLKDRTNNTISQLKQLEELNNKLDRPTQLEASVYQYNSLKDHLRERNHQDIVREAFVNLDQNIQSKENDFGPSKELDFAFIGWPKTGTSFLLKVLGDHPEVTMPESEFCDLTVAQDGGEKNLTRWMMTSQHKSLKSSVPQKYGIKCPHMIRKTQSIERLAMVYDSTRLVVGVRHPVLWFQRWVDWKYLVLLLMSVMNTMVLMYMCCPIDEAFTTTGKIAELLCITMSASIPDF